MRMAIVVVAYKRYCELKRLLSQISKAYCHISLDLIVSIDNSDIQDSMCDLANSFEWPHGEKTIIKRSANLGLKRHVLECGDISYDYDAVIMLEEDLILSKHFINFASTAVSAYKDDSRISGISLYSYQVRESDKMPFYPVDDGSDAYFIQFASSWGQVFTAPQWYSFRQWLTAWDCDSFEDKDVPGYISSWPASSWKKHYIRYNIKERKFFVFPRVGLSSNPGANGDNHSYIYKLYSSPILHGHKGRVWDFAPLDLDESVIYDANFLIVKNCFFKDNFMQDAVEFCLSDKAGNAEQFFSYNPLRSIFYLKLFFLSCLNDCKKIIAKAIRIIR